MIQRHGNLDFGVVVTDANGQPLPAVVHEGVTYIVCTAGQEFQVQVSCKTLQHWDPSQSYQVNLTVDGKSCGYSYTLEMQHPTSNFNGWWLDHKSKRAFVFTAPSEVRGDSQGATKKPELGSLKAIFAEAEEYPCPASGGAECSECDFLGHGTKTVTKAVPEEAAALKQVSQRNQSFSS